MGKFKPFSGMQYQFNFKQMMGGRGLLKAGWGWVPSAFAGRLEALQPELWHERRWSSFQILRTNLPEWVLIGTFHPFDLCIFLDRKEVDEHSQCWRPNEALRILLGGIGKEELVKMATLLCISAQGALLFSPIPATLSMQMSEPRLIQITRTLPIAMGRYDPIPKIGPGRGAGEERWPECTITVRVHIHWTLKTPWEGDLQHLT